MSIKPGLITGSNCKITVDSKTVAYATDLQYMVETTTIPVEVMGRYEVVTNEPIATMVNGSFTVVRYAKGLASTAGLSDTSVNSNGTKNMAGNMGNAFNPGEMLTTETVDIIVYQKTKSSATAAADVQKIVKITDCRLVRKSGSVNKRGILTESYQFVGVLLTDDSHEVDVSRSGVGTDMA